MGTVIYKLLLPNKTHTHKRRIQTDKIYSMKSYADTVASPATNWEEYVDPTREEEFDNEVLKAAKHEQDLFDDRVLTGMFHWHPDQYQEQVSNANLEPKILKRKTVRFQEKAEIRLIQHRLNQSLSIDEEKHVLSKQTVDDIFSNDTCVSDDELLKSTSAIFSMNFEDSSSSCSDSDTDSASSSNQNNSSGYNSSSHQTTNTRTNLTATKSSSYSFNVNVQAFVPGQNRYASNLKL